MPELLCPVIREFYEDGLCAILDLLPMNMEEDERLLIESVIYTGYGLFRAYENLEMTLYANTSDEGAFSHSYQTNRDAFLHAWAFVDNAYALFTLAGLRSARELFKLSEETLTFGEQVSSLRNYMDHLPANFKNVARGRNFAPLFGWMSYQFTPKMRRPSASGQVIYITNLASTHLKEDFNLNANENSTAEVLGAVDNVTLHVRRNDKVNLSRLLANLTLELNTFSILTQTRLVERFQDETYDHGGLRMPFPQLVVRGDLDAPFAILNLRKPLDHNKVRAKVTDRTIARKD